MCIVCDHLDLSPVKLIAGCPIACSAIAISETVRLFAGVRSMSISRWADWDLVPLRRRPAGRSAFRGRRRLRLPLETAFDRFDYTMLRPVVDFFRVSDDVPPNFCTKIALRCSFVTFWLFSLYYLILYFGVSLLLNPFGYICLNWEEYTGYGVGFARVLSGAFLAILGGMFRVRFFSGAFYLGCLY